MDKIVTGWLPLLTSIVLLLRLIRWITVNFETTWIKLITNILCTFVQTLVHEIMPNPGNKKADSMPIGDFDPEDDRDQFRQYILTQIAFNHVILDEGHVIRNPDSGVSKAVCRLHASRRWIVTGTPVHNQELDMYSLLRFLRVRPFNQLEVRN